MRAFSEELPNPLDGERVDRVVAMITGCSRAEAAAAVVAGHVHLDGRTVTRGADRVRSGERLDVDADPTVHWEPPLGDTSVPIDALYTDDDVIVVDKPAGVVVHPAPGHRTATLVNGLLDRHPELAGVGQADRPGIVHRLDRFTSGLMVVARSPEAYRSLVEQLSNHEVEREYRALCWGGFATSHGTIDAPVGRSRRDPLRMTVSVLGKAARTHYEVKERYVGDIEVTELRCRLETGRTHQIRVHLSSIGRPVVGDELYGGRRAALPMERPFLHAERLTFRHPVSGRVLSFESALPSELTDVTDRLRSLGERGGPGAPTVGHLGEVLEGEAFEE